MYMYVLRAVVVGLQLPSMPHDKKRTPDRHVLSRDTVSHRGLFYRAPVTQAPVSSPSPSQSGGRSGG